MEKEEYIAHLAAMITRIELMINQASSDDGICVSDAEFDLHQARGFLFGLCNGSHEIFHDA